jgi:hypothetical protein
MSETFTKSYRYQRYDLTHYSDGAVPLDACRNHDHEEEKYRFFRPILTLFINSEQMN